MVAKLTSLFVTLVAAISSVQAATTNRINHHPTNANKIFKDNYEPKQAHYIAYGATDGHPGTSTGQICSEWHKAAYKLQQTGGANRVSANCRIVDHVHQVAAVWATEAQNRGHTFSQTGPVGYSLTGVTFVSPKKEPYYSQGGTCEKIEPGWCRDKFVPHFGVDLTTQGS